MCYALPVNTFWVIDLFHLVLKISNRFYTRLNEIADRIRRAGNASDAKILQMT
jgi:hypothetical protein